MIPIKTKLIAGLIVCAACRPRRKPGSNIMYTVTDLGTLGGPESIPNAISQNGIIVGNAMVSVSSNHPFIYRGNGPMQDIGLLDPVNGVPATPIR